MSGEHRTYVGLIGRIYNFVLLTIGCDVACYCKMQELCKRNLKVSSSTHRTSYSGCQAVRMFHIFAAHA